MSLDLVVWLSCSVALAQDLPNHGEWRYHKVSASAFRNLPKELVARFDGLESWQVDRESYLIRATYADRAEEPENIENGSETIATKRQAELAHAANVSKTGISLVLEGSYDAGYPEQAAVANHLARKCDGAVVETPTGYYEIDRSGEWIK